MFAQDSIELLQSSGIDFEKFEHLGIDVQVRSNPYCTASLHTK